jgi:hypothetical protein
MFSVVRASEMKAMADLAVEAAKGEDSEEAKLLQMEMQSFESWLPGLLTDMLSQIQAAMYPAVADGGYEVDKALLCRVSLNPLAETKMLKRIAQDLWSVLCAAGYRVTTTPVPRSVSSERMSCVRVILSWRLLDGQ